MKRLYRVGAVLGLSASMLLAETFISPLSVVGAALLQSGPNDPTPPIIYQPISPPTQGPGATPNIVSGAYTPANIRAAYNFGALASGSNVHIAVVDAYGDRNSRTNFLSSDLATFNSTFGLPAATVNTYTPYGTSGSNSGWAMETALDVEWAHACAPNATIDLIIARSSSWADLINAINYAVRLKTVSGYNVVAISMSFGASESPALNSGGSSSIYSQGEAAFTAALAAGIVPVASSGDGGAKDGTSSLTPEYPASSPQVLSVGGTTLTLSGGGYGSETAWSGSGGGYSTQFSEPSFQTGGAIPDATAMRGVPDVSLDADPNTGVNVLQGGTWYQVGGTSMSAPIWAAITADNAAVNPGSPITLSSMYSIYGSAGNGPSYPSDIHDVLSGNNVGLSAMTSGTTNNLQSVWGSSASDVFAVGASGTILHYNGTSWSAMTSGTTNNLQSVWGSSSQ